MIKRHPNEKPPLVDGDNVDEVQISVFDRANELVLRRFIDGNGTRHIAQSR